MLNKFLGFVAHLAFVAAIVAAGTASYGGMYQPKEPSILRKHG